MKTLVYILLLMIGNTIMAQEVAGKWSGILRHEGVELEMILNISKAAAGYAATLDIPLQGAKDIPLVLEPVVNNKIVFTLAQAGITYKGMYTNNTINGSYSQGGIEIPLNFVPAKKLMRPQTPLKPYPYHEEDVTFTNEKAGITLAGTLFLPKKEGTYPAVVLISGSGPQNRDEEIFDHKPFLVLADHLTRNGYAVLRYDDRGVGASKGDFGAATSADFATDAEAAFNYLKNRKEINKKKIGLMGHSEGGTIAPMVAEKNPDVAFIVMLAGTGISGAENMVLQNYLLGKADGMPEEELTKLGNINRKLYVAAMQDNTDATRKAAITEVLNRELGPLLSSKGVPQDAIKQNFEMQAAGLSSPWYVGFLKHDPAHVIAKLKMPILAINGDKDLQVAATANLDGVKRAAAKGGNTNVTTKTLPGLNHLFQQCVTCKVDEYGNLEQTFSPSALNEITSWLKVHVK